MKARSIVVAAVAAVLLAEGAVFAEDLAHKISIGIEGGTQSDIAGQLIKGGQGTMLGKQTTLEAKGYRDIYGPKVRYQAFVSYGVTAKLEVLLRGSYYESKPVGVAAGSYDGKPLFALPGQAEDTGRSDGKLIVEPYKEYGGELALRYYFAPQSRLKSFIAPVLGGRRVNRLLLSLSSPDAGSRLMNVPFTEAATVLVAGIDIGFGFDITDNFFVGVDTGVRYQAAPPAEGSAQLAGLGGVDESDARWTAPVVLMLGVRF